jgi:hypothetical protein
MRMWINFEEDSAESCDVVRDICCCDEAQGLALFDEFTRKDRTNGYTMEECEGEVQSIMNIVFADKLTDKTSRVPCSLELIAINPTGHFVSMDYQRYFLGVPIGSGGSDYYICSRAASDSEVRSLISDLFNAPTKKYKAIGAAQEFFPLS